VFVDGDTESDCAMRFRYYWGVLAGEVLIQDGSTNVHPAPKNPSSNETASHNRFQYHHPQTQISDCDLGYLFCAFGAAIVSLTVLLLLSAA
jgi:hypothetical protein